MRGESGMPGGESSSSSAIAGISQAAQGTRVASAGTAGPVALGEERRGVWPQALWTHTHPASLTGSTESCFIGETARNGLCCRASHLPWEWKSSRVSLLKKCSPRPSWGTPSRHSMVRWSPSCLMVLTCSFKNWDLRKLHNCVREDRGRGTLGPADRFQRSRHLSPGHLGQRLHSCPGSLPLPRHSLEFTGPKGKEGGGMLAHHYSTLPVPFGSPLSWEEQWRCV